jgi:hypothetical protein
MIVLHASLTPVIPFAKPLVQASAISFSRPPLSSFFFFFFFLHVSAEASVGLVDHEGPSPIHHLALHSAS